MTGVQPARFEDGRPMLLAGVRRHHAFSAAQATIPSQWRELMRLGALPGQVSAIRYGVVCGSSAEEQTFEYMCAVEVASFDGLAGEVGRMRVPPQRYAVFVHAGPASTLRATWDAIWGEWLPRSGLEPANTPDFERYDERFDPTTGTGVIEIWFPIATGGQAVWKGQRPGVG